MKAIRPIITAAFLLPLQLFANGVDTSAEAYYYTAKQHIENMLSGKEPMSYEKAIYEIENAWWEGKLNYVAFEAQLNDQTKKIKDIIGVSKKGKKTDFKSDFQETAENKKVNYEKALVNFAIYRYMTSSSLWHLSYRYAASDPLGTNDWTTTQVSNLIKTGEGNCFALASLFKIFSERLHSDAMLCTAPSHIYICHRDEKGTLYNVEVASKVFPGTGTIETLTYTVDEAIKNNISLRELDIKQSIALCLVYLAKGYEYKFKDKDNDFILSCSQEALQYDDHDLNAMLLKAEVLENRIVKQQRTIQQLQQTKEFKEYQEWVGHIFALGYREMPYEMKNILIKGWKKDTTIRLAITDHTPRRPTHSTVPQTLYASLSWGVFDEEIKTKRVERYGNTVFDTKTKKIIDFLPSDILYNQYNFDPVLFALNVDPLAHKFPWQSPYCTFDNSPIWKNDPTGSSGEVSIDKQSKTITVTSHIDFYGGKASTAIAKQTADNIQSQWNAANATVKIDNVEYNVRFSVTGTYRTDLTQSEVAANTDIKNNYVRIEDKNSEGVSYMSNNGNTGFFQYNNIEGANSTTGSHEYGHGLGLWQGTDDGHPPDHDITGQGQPGIMYARGTLVDPQYQYDPKAAPGKPGGTLNPDKRKVLQSDVSQLGLDKLQYNSDGKANLGTTTNKYYNEGE